MEVAKISSKGQITIPVSIRNKLKLKTGDKVVIFEEDGRFYFENSAMLAFKRAEEAFVGEAEKAGFTHTGVDENESEKKERINMRSMLFCRHGGLITPVKSGQIMAQYDLKELRISGNYIALSNTTIQPSYSLTRYTQKKIQDLCEQNGVVYFDEDGYQSWKHRLTI